jgi:hypothetical protein
MNSPVFLRLALLAKLYAFFARYLIDLGRSVPEPVGS